MFLNHMQEFRERLRLGERAMPRDGHILHPEFGHDLLLVIALAAPHVNHDLHAHLLERFESIHTGLASSKQLRRDLAKIRQPHIVLPAAHRSLRRRRWMGLLSNPETDRREKERAYRES